MIFLILTKEKPGPNIPEMPGVYVAGDWAGHDEILADAAVQVETSSVTHFKAI